MVPTCVNSTSEIGRKPVAGSTIARRIRTSRFEGGSGRCSAAGGCEDCRSSHPSTPRSTPFSTRGAVFRHGHLQAEPCCRSRRVARSSGSPTDCHCRQTETSAIRLTAPRSAVSERLSMAQGLMQTGPFRPVGKSADARPGPSRKHPFPGIALRDRSESLKVILPHRSPARAPS